MRRRALRSQAGFLSSPPCRFVIEVWREQVRGVNAQVQARVHRFVCERIRGAVPDTMIAMLCPQ